ncbi:ribosomal protection-like ABC-F family protein [Lachnospira rogosae (ex Hitch et al. 2025)]|uniref:ribosomal protection-like ABC-F family protein n=2 Tax=[Lactobacillus] rogosae TaxID=706562 RepID=UPI0032C1C031
MILSCNNISKSFGTDVIIKSCSFNIEDHEKAAIVGINGAGKSTLLKIITGIEPADTGLVTLAKDKTLGYLSQQQNLNSDNTIYDELLSVKHYILDMEAQLRSIENQMKSADDTALETLMKKYSDLNHEFELNNGYAYKSEITGVLKGLGFAEEDFTLNVNTLSGGQKTRVALGRLLLSKPDIILLDEPTNHLDMESISWLENYLLNYSGAVLIVAHDRYFLDKIVSKIIELDNGNATVFSGNYTDYASKKAILRNMQLKEYLNQQREIKHQEEVITKLKQFNREKSIKRAESREKMLNKMEFVDKPEILNDKMDIKLEPNVISGNDVLTVDNLTKGFDGTVLFDNICFQIKRGERVALIGSNGTGKTTILKLINGIIPADSGSIYLGAKVNIGYYDQEHHVLDPDKTIFDEIRDAYPDLNNTQIRNTLAAFLFTNEDVFKYIKDLSGGERGRVSLAKLMLSNANFLILDEPTNHLDITSKEILENALNSYTGTVLFVSHDRYFINSTATRIIELANKTVVNYIGNYDYYLEKKDILGAKPITNNTSKSSSSAISKLNWQEEKVKQAQQKKIKNEIKRTEERMALIEAEIEELDNMYADPAISSDTAKLMEIHTRKEALSKELDELYDKWGELTL